MKNNMYTTLLIETMHNSIRYIHTHTKCIIKQTEIVFIQQRTLVLIRHTPPLQKL